MPIGFDMEKHDENFWEWQEFLIKRKKYQQTVRITLESLHVSLGKWDRVGGGGLWVVRSYV